jgi:hypothetical protein
MMANFHLRGTLSCLGILALAGSAPVRAADATPEEVLKKQGLRPAGTLYVLQLETDVQRKVNEVRRLTGQLKLALVKQAGTASAKDRGEAIKNLTAHIKEYQAAIEGVNQQVRAIPRPGGRWARFGGYGNSLNNDAVSELIAYRGQLQAEMSQARALLDQLRQPFDSAARDRVDAEVRDRRDSYHQALVDLRKLVDSTAQKYAELARSAEVKQALDSLGKRGASKPKLGPSPQYLASVKLLERFEKAGNDGETQSAPPKAVRHTRKSARGKRAAAGAGAASDDPF